MIPADVPANEGERLRALQQMAILDTESEERFDRLTRLAQDMFKAAERENTLITWLVRLAGTFGVFLGFALVLRPLVVIGDFIPLIGSILGAGAGP